MNQIRDVVNLDTKAFIMFSDLIKQFYEVKSDALKVLDLKLSHLKILHLLSDHNGINQQEIAGHFRKQALHNFRNHFRNGE